MQSIAWSTFMPLSLESNQHNQSYASTSVALSRARRPAVCALRNASNLFATTDFYCCPTLFMEAARTASSRASKRSMPMTTASPGTRGLRSPEWRCPSMLTKDERRVVLCPTPTTIHKTWGILSGARVAPGGTRCKCPLLVMLMSHET